MKKRTQLFLLAATLCVGFVTGVTASTNETITATLNRTISILHNGSYQTFYDANGDVVYPISYNGTTYLPVRSVAGLVDLDVDYDATTETVILGTVEVQPTSITSLSHTAGTSYSSIILDAEELNVVGDSATMTYSNGIKWHQWNSKLSSGKDRDIDFNVTGYSTVTFTVWSEVDANAGIFDEGGNVIYTFENKAGAITTKTIDISDYDTIAFASNGLGYGDTYDGYVKFLDVYVQ
ncbi:MAG: hypothetical protein R3Y09_05710 [Clostridia bacterium]